jgi:hypothetical protein
VLRPGQAEHREYESMGQAINEQQQSNSGTFRKRLSMDRAGSKTWSTDQSDTDQTILEN